jgi:crotonobetainyl-CoA:carnitine CoA-transferase CaiB-like acyl-CoA transferase
VTFPLENVMILDLTHVPPGQFCTMMLGDMGAHVLRVEQPLKGSDSIEADPAASEWERLMTVGYKVFNRGKSSISLNLRSEQARDVLYRIAAKADVVVEGFRPGVVERLGIDYRTLRSMNPRIIYCSMSGYGQHGPYRDMPGHDINFVAMGGALSLFGDPPPVIPNIIADYAGATLHSVIGILLALIARDKTGKGQHVDISYTDCVVSLVTQFASAYLAAGRAIAETSWRMMFSNAGYGVYRTKDRKYISLGCVEPWFWGNLCEAVGREDLIREYARWEKHEEIRSIFAEIFLTKTMEEWFDLLKGRNIPVGKVQSLDEVFDDPQMLHRQMLVEIENSRGSEEKHIGIPIKLSDTPGVIRSTAPIPGQQTEQVLLDLGYTKKEIERLSKERVIFLPELNGKSP